MNPTDQMVRTRFAPSPTGMLHIGGARTALFSWLYARHLGGEFVLRIEDTDRERSTDASTQVILDGLRWLGLAWDGEPIFQSTRQAQHLAAVEQLLAEGKAYRCDCSREELDQMRAAQREAGEKPRYDGRCRHRTDVSDDAPSVVRLRFPDTGVTTVNDLILGTVEFQNTELDDLIIMRSDGTPTYNLAVVVDDADMGITHVIRGSDHLNNTPKQIYLYQALGRKIPLFAHIPLIHGSDGAKMSKRHGAVAITEYRKAGYLSDAVVNYLVRLGWAHGDEEIFSREQLIALFDIEQGVGKTAARFDQKKLDWLNAHYIRHTAVDSLVEAVKPLIDYDTQTGAPLHDVIPTLQERSTSLHELTEGARFFYCPPVSYQEKAVRKHIKPDTWPLLDAFIRGAQDINPWCVESVHELIQDVCNQADVKMGKLAQPIRIFVSGGPVSPPIDVTLALLGREESLSRFAKAREVLDKA